MDKRSKSSSHVQRHAEDVIFPLLEEKLGLVLEKNQKIVLSDAAHIEPDFYSESGKVVGEIYSHIGTPKPGQQRKIANDILKLLLLEKATGEKFRKIIVVCDEAVHRYLIGKSFVAESIRQFDIEVLLVEVPSELKSEILLAQKDQEMVNA